MAVGDADVSHSLAHTRIHTADDCSLVLNGLVALNSAIHRELSVLPQTKTIVTTTEGQILP